MIDRVLILNLKRRVDRRFACYGHLLSMNVNESCIEFFTGTEDARKYKDSEDILHHAIADGFTQYEQLIPEWVKNGGGSPGSLCCTWGYQKMLRDVVRRGDCVLTMMDDFFMPFEWSILLDIVQNIGDFRIIQLTHFIPEDFGFSIRNIDMSALRLKSYNKFLNIGLAGPGDRGLIVKPEGAQLILEKCKEYPAYNFESIVGYLAMDKPSGCYSVKKGILERTLNLSRLLGKRDTDIAI